MKATKLGFFDNTGFIALPSYKLAIWMIKNKHLFLDFVELVHKADTTVTLNDNADILSQKRPALWPGSVSNHINCPSTTLWVYEYLK